MKCIDFAAQADALAFSIAVDAALGYPLEGVDVGGGRHAEGATTTFGDVRHEAGAWRYLYLDTPGGDVAALAAARGLASTEYVPPPADPALLP